MKIRGKVAVVVSVDLCIVVALWWLSGITTTAWAQSSPQTTASDFNGDGFADLAVGIPGATVGFSATQAGRVRVWYGSASGVSTVGRQIWHQDSPGVRETAEPNDRFGASVAAGDFNGDGFADLAIGAYGEALGTVVEAGVVHILYGSAKRLTTQGNQVFHQDRPGVQETAEGSDVFWLCAYDRRLQWRRLCRSGNRGPWGGTGKHRLSGDCAYPVRLSQRVNGTRQSDIPSGPPRGAGNG